MLETILEKSQTVSVLSENILTRLFQILSVNIKFYSLRQKYTNESCTGKTILCPVCKTHLGDLRLYEEANVSNKKYLKYLTLLTLVTKNKNGSVYCGATTMNSCVISFVFN